MDQSEGFKELSQMLVQTAQNLSGNISEEDKEKMMKNVNIQEMMKFSQQMFTMIGGGKGGDMNVEDIFGIRGEKNTVKTLNENVPQTQPTTQCAEEDCASDEESEVDDQEVIKPKTNDLHYTINLKLSELYSGKKKRILFVRKNFKKNEETKKYEIFEEKKRVVIPIKPGTKPGETILFTKEADHSPGHIPGDVIITIAQTDDEVYERDNNDLHSMKNISFSEVFQYDSIHTHLDGTKYRIRSELSDILIKNDCIRKIKGLGMPIKDTNKYGDLYIRFHIVFPDHLSPEAIQTLKTIIPPLDSTPDTDSDSKPVTLSLLTSEEQDKLLMKYEYSDEDDFDESEADDDDDDDDDESEADDDDDDDEADDDEIDDEADDDEAEVEEIEESEDEAEHRLKEKSSSKEKPKKEELKQK